MPDEHASEFAETLAALKSEDHDPSNSEQTEFADIIDEEEVKSAKLARGIGTIILIFFYILLFKS